MDDSPCWTDFLKIGPYYLKGRKIVIGNGLTARFWEDTWISSKPFSLLFPILYRICNEKEMSVAQGYDSHWRFSFRRWLNPTLQEQWNLVLGWISGVQLSNEGDKVVWMHTKSGVFNVKSA